MPSTFDSFLRIPACSLSFELFGFDNYWDASDFALAHDGLLVESRGAVAVYRHLCGLRPGLDSYRFLVLVPSTCDDSRDFDFENYSDWMTNV